MIPDLYPAQAHVDDDQDQSEASFEVTWPVLTNQRPELRSMTSLDQSEASINVSD